MSSLFKNTQLYLIGFMGAGKTTVGKLLAEKLNRPFVDIDDVIEKKTDLTIPLIFEKYGEDYFRKFETDVLERIAKYPDNVIATGGGIILKAKNRETMKKTGITIYLRCDPATLYQRIKNSTHRPLLKSINNSPLVQLIETMLQQRQPFYETADIILDANDDRAPREIASTIIQQLLLKT